MKTVLSNNFNQRRQGKPNKNWMKQWKIHTNTTKLSLLIIMLNYLTLDYINATYLMLTSFKVNWLYV